MRDKEYIERGAFLRKCTEAWGHYGVTIKAIEGIADECAAADVVSRGVFEQVKLERDMAMQQLEEHGIPFCGVADDVVNVVRCKDCKHAQNMPLGLCYLHTEPYDNARGYKGDAVCVEPYDFCSCGERKEQT